MEKKLFQDLLTSLKQAKAISKGTAKPSRRFKVEVTDVKAIREHIGLTQDEFARLIRVSVRTIQNWEQQRRQPTGPAAALLQIVAKEPKVACSHYMCRCLTGWITTDFQ